jgi:hypothetical protein
MPLRVRFLATGDGSGTLTAEASHGDFAGRSEAPFTAEEIVRFANALLEGTEEQIERESLSRGESSEETFGLTLYPTGIPAVIGAQIRMASGRAHAGQMASRLRAHVVYETNRDEVERFARALLRVVLGEREFAELHPRKAD